MSVKRYCHRCQTVVDRGHKHRPPDLRPSARERGYDARWQRTRSDFLSAFPTCQWHEGCISLARDVHHIDGKGPLGARGHDWSNLQSLCGRHHAQTTSVDQPGGWNRPGYVRSYDET